MKKFAIILMLMLCTIGFVSAQRTISGRVNDPKGEPMVGASVVVKGTTTGVTTDLDGQYRLTVPAAGTAKDCMALAGEKPNEQNQWFAFNTARTGYMTMNKNLPQYPQCLE